MFSLDLTSSSDYLIMSSDSKYLAKKKANILSRFGFDKVFFVDNCVFLCMFLLSAVFFAFFQVCVRGLWFE